MPSYIRDLSYNWLMKYLKQIRPLCWTCTSTSTRTCTRWFMSRPEIIREGDRALLRYKETAFLTKPLQPGKSNTAADHGHISHDHIIGKQVRDFVMTSKGVKLRVHLPTLEEYVTLTPRIVTPIYPKYANLIVSLLDIHVSHRDPTVERSTILEILEAGTGHGGLTLHLARAIHVANLPLSRKKKYTATSVEGNVTPSAKTILDTRIPGLGLETPFAPTFDITEASETRIDGSELISDRQAVIHSLDISPSHLHHAKKLVEGFRHGQYAGDVEFHVGEVSAWIDQQLIHRGLHSPEIKDKAFLSHVILDLPGSQSHLEKAASVLHVNGTLIVFNPSITQIIACVKEIKLNMLPLELDRILEVDQGMVGGREWDVRAMRPRALARAETEKRVSLEEERASTGASNQSLREDGGDSGIDTKQNDPIKELVKEEIDWYMVCRPKFTERWSGGGFVGVWKKMRRDLTRE